MRIVAAAFLVLLSFFNSAEDNINILGLVTDSEGKKVADLSIVVNQQSWDIQNDFSLSLRKSQVYQLTFSAPGYYSSIQTFSHKELLANNNVGEITLVKKKAKRVMLAFAGDVMMGRRYYKPYFNDEVLIHQASKLADSKDIVKHVKPYMSLADFSAVNLETQIATETPAKKAPKSVVFYSQPEILEALSWAGIDYVSLGNNHTYDYLDSGLVSTLEALDKSSLGYSGAGINEQSALAAYQKSINGNPYSMLGYVGWEGSAIPNQTASSKKGGAAFGSMENILSSVKREQSLARTSIVQYHGSQEYANEPTGVTEQRLKSALDAGASVAIAHHPHVTQGIELYNNKLIAYSMGNFIFDQNFPSTQFSYILYVWLDGKDFYRAEIVPIYVQGYKPTPATDSQRYTVLKRLYNLSKSRNTEILRSGGHGVITNIENEKLTQADSQIMSLVQPAIAYPLEQLMWHHSIDTVNLVNQTAYRLGTNLINGSDFERFNFSGEKERGWLYDKDKVSLSIDNSNDNASLKLALSHNQSSFIGMQSFRRVYRKSNPMTVSASIKSKGKVAIKVYWQGRKTRQKLFDAFKNSPKHLIGETVIDSDKWQTISMDFNSPRIGYKSYRVLVEIVNEGSDNRIVYIDDMRLLEWQTAFSKDPKVNYVNPNTQQATYIGFKKPYKGEVKVTYK